MSKYIGQPCTSCRAVFKEGDEIVVCPDCGSPYHRDCYKREGKCVNTVLHETGKEWQPQFTAQQPEQRPAGENVQHSSERVCSNCGTHNAPDAAYCTGCGAALSPDGERSRQQFGQNQQYGQNTQGQWQQGPYGQFGGQQFGGPFGPMGGFMFADNFSAEADVDGNTVGEYTSYVGRNKMFYFIPKFMRFAKTGQKVSFNFAAFLVPPFWFAYRKMPVYSAITMIVSILTSIPQLLCEMTYAGFIPTTERIASSSFQMIYALSGLISFAVTLASGVFANWLYYKKAKSDITAIKTEITETESRRSAIVKAGGISGAYLAAAFAVLFVASFILSAVLM